MTEETWALVEERAPATPGRDRSGYIQNLVEEDLREVGLLPGDDMADLAELKATAVEVGGFKNAADMLRKIARKGRETVAQKRQTAAA